MKRHLFLVMLCLLVIGVTNASAQRRRSADTKNSIRTDTKSTVRLNPNRPSVYLEFVRAGVCRPSEYWTPCVGTRGEIAEEPYDAVWLRITNNSRWPINFDAVSTHVTANIDLYKLPDGKLVTSTQQGAEVKARYRVDGEIVWERVEGSKGVEHKLVDVKVPIVNRVVSISTRVWLPPGRSSLFVVRRDHLAKHLSVYLPYKYLWDGDQNDTVSSEPTHRVYFSWYELQKALGQVASK